MHLLICDRRLGQLKREERVSRANKQMRRCLGRFAYMEPRTEKLYLQPRREM